MEQRIAELEKLVQKLQSELDDIKINIVQALGNTSEKLMQQVEELIEEYREGYKEATISILKEKLGLK